MLSAQEIHSTEVSIMSSTSDFEGDHSKPQGVTKATSSLKGEAQTPVADMEMPLRVEADQYLSSKGQDQDEATKDDARAPGAKKEAEKRLKDQVDAVEGAVPVSVEHDATLKRKVCLRSIESRSDGLIDLLSERRS